MKFYATEQLLLPNDMDNPDANIQCSLLQWKILVTYTGLFKNKINK